MKMIQDRINMRRMLLLLLAAPLLVEVSSQPIGCQDDSQCPSGFHCDDTLFCRECLRCEDLKREPLLPSHTCVTSVSKCGACIKGLVEDREGDVNSQCMRPATSLSHDQAGEKTTEHPEEPSAESMPGYVWAAIVTGILFIAILVFILVYALRNIDSLKIRASTRTSVQGPIGNGGMASAPDLPPPYNAGYTPVRPTSPADVADDRCEDLPFIKLQQDDSGAGGYRTTAGSQAASLSNQPVYVRGPFLPPSYDSTLSEETEPEPVADHDDATMESLWTPGDTHDRNRAAGEEAAVEGATGGAVGAALPALLADARNTTLLQPPPAKILRQERNNNTASNNHNGEGSSGAHHGSGTVVINVVQNINTMQQRNDISL